MPLLPNKNVDRIISDVDRILPDETPVREHEIRVRKIRKCQEFRGVTACELCNQAEFCSFLQNHMRMTRYHFGQKTR